MLSESDDGYCGYMYILIALCEQVMLLSNTTTMVHVINIRLPSHEMHKFIISSHITVHI